MSANKNPNIRDGQGLVEYALAIAVVAVVALVAVGLIGWAANRLFGIAGGAFGAKKNDTNTGVMFYAYFETNQLPQCGYVPPPYANPGVTQLYTKIHVSPNIPISEVTISTDYGFIAQDTVNLDHGDEWNMQPVLATGSDDTLCPHSIVMQTSPQYGGITAGYPVLVKDW